METMDEIEARVGKLRPGMRVVNPRGIDVGAIAVVRSILTRVDGDGETWVRTSLLAVGADGRAVLR